MAGLFRDLNTNLWQTYAYSTNAANTGLTFDHALNVWLNRRVATVAGRATAQDILTEDSRPQLGSAGDTTAASRVLPVNGVDDFSDGPLIQSLAQVRNPRLLADGDLVTRRWSGGDVSNPYLTPSRCSVIRTCSCWGPTGSSGPISTPVAADSPDS